MSLGSAGVSLVAIDSSTRAMGVMKVRPHHVSVGGRSGICVPVTYQSGYIVSENQDHNGKATAQFRGYNTYLGSGQRRA